MIDVIGGERLQCPQRTVIGNQASGRASLLDNKTDNRQGSNHLYSAMYSSFFATFRRKRIRPEFVSNTKSLPELSSTATVRPSGLNGSPKRSLRSHWPSLPLPSCTSSPVLPHPQSLPYPNSMTPRYEMRSCPPARGIISDTHRSSIRPFVIPLKRTYSSR